MDCNYIEEIFQDPSLTSPKGLRLSLLAFSQTPGAGNPVSLPMWYRFRYVNTNTGGYSDFSDWTQSYIQAGAIKLPCVAGFGNCNKKYVQQGTKSCKFNQPTVGIEKGKLQYNPTTLRKDGSYIYINVHRYVSPSTNDTDPPPSGECTGDEIIGTLLLPLTQDSASYMTFIDAANNPCDEICTPVKGC